MRSISSYLSDQQILTQINLIKQVHVQFTTCRIEYVLCYFGCNFNAFEHIFIETQRDLGIFIRFGKVFFILIKRVRSVVYNDFLVLFGIILFFKDAFLNQEKKIFSQKKKYNFITIFIIEINCR